jgi:hypothetical protein
VKEFTCDASSAAADLASAQSFCKRGQSMSASFRRDRSGLRCGQGVAMCQLRPKPAEPLPAHGGNWREV